MESTSSSSLLESMVPDAILLAAASCLEGSELMQLEMVSKKFHNLKEDLEKEVWKDICHRRWNNIPRYRWEKLEKAQPILVTKSWKQRYLWVEKDCSRTEITWEDLQKSEWYFNFKPCAGGRGLQTLQKCFFPQKGSMTLMGWPAPLRCQLVQGRRHQLMLINEFPPHAIDRCKNGEWCIQNQNVLIVSCPPA